MPTFDPVTDVEMTEEMAIDILARRHVAEMLATKSGVFPERKLPTATLRAVQAHIQQMADDMRPPRASYEVAYDVLAHPPVKREVL